MKERGAKSSNHTIEQATPAGRGSASQAGRVGLAVEGPGFFVWDEVASEARKRAAELGAVAPQTMQWTL